jgi:hypothetical protein
MLSGILAILFGLASFFGAGRWADAVKKRMREGGDEYFEEQRSYRSYPHLHDPKWIRIGGLVMIAVGVLDCALHVMPGR